MQSRKRSRLRAPSPRASSGRRSAASVASSSRPPTRSGLRISDAEHLTLPSDAAAAILKGGPIEIPGMDRAAAVMFWQVELSKARGAVAGVSAMMASALDHEELCRQRLIKAAAEALVPPEGPVHKRRKVSKTAGTGSGKGKGKARADDPMDEDDVVDVDAERSEPEGGQEGGAGSDDDDDEEDDAAGDADVSPA